MVASSSKMSPSENEDLTGVMWNDRLWTSCFPLNEQTAMDYFSLSQFYDKSCNNELIKMQHLDPALLQTMDGIEYKRQPCPAPNLFIITKSRRTVDPPKLEPLATYYIHEANIYQAPSIHAILSSRVLQSLHHLRNSFDTMQAAVTLASNGEYTWDPTGNSDDPAASPNTDNRSLAERRAVDRMLYDVMERNKNIVAAQEEKQGVSENVDAPATLPPPR